MIAARRCFSIATIAVLFSGMIPVTAHAQFGRLWKAWRFANPNVIPEPPDADQSDFSGGVELPDDGDLRRKLEQVRQELQNKNYTESVRQLGHWLQNPDVRDFFLNREGQKRDGRSFKAEVRKLIAELPEEGRRAYAVQFETAAKQRLADAVLRGDEAALREVSRRFPYTQAGFEALYRLAGRLWDHDRPYASAVCLERLRERPEVWKSFQPTASVLLAGCLTRTGDRDRAVGILRRLRDESTGTVKIAGVEHPLSFETDADAMRWITRVIPGQKGSPGGDRDWMVHRGDAGRSRSVPAGEPFLAPRWSQVMSEEPRTLSALARAAEAHGEGRDIHLPMPSPIALGPLVLSRTVQGVVAFDLATGRRAWQYPSDDDPGNAGWEQVVWSEPAGGAFSADEECFYLLGEPRFAISTSADPFEEDLDVGPGENTLTAHEHARGRQGNLRWQTGGSDGGVEPRLADVYFLGPPLPWQGRLYVLGENKGTIFVYVLNARTGRLEWSQDLGTAQQKVGADAFRRMAGATPSVSPDEILVCPTSGGVVVAVDLATQNLLWAYRYPRRQPGQTNPYGQMEMRLDQSDRWLDATAIVSGKYVLLTPPESNELHCLDLHDGRLLWTQPRGDGLYAACAAGDRAIVAGKKKLHAYRLADGNPAWKRPLELPRGALPGGMGIVTSSHYILPTTAGEIVRVDLAKGTIDGRYRTLRESVLGNLVWHNGIFISQGATFLEAFDELALLKIAVRDALDKNPNDPFPLIRQGEMDLQAGRTDAALGAFRKAHQASPSSRTRSALTAALLDALRNKEADRERLSAELDALLDR